MEKNKISSACLFVFADKKRGENGTYWEKIKPSLVSAREYLSDSGFHAEWQKRHEEKALSEYYGAGVTVRCKFADELPQKIIFS